MLPDTLACQHLSRGMDRSQLREYKLPPIAYFPVASPVMLQQPAQHRPHVDLARWPEIAERARHESLRALAAEYGVSHETIRTISKRVTEQQRAVPAA